MRCQECLNEQGLLVLAKSDLKLSYLIENNTNSIKTTLKSNLILKIDDGSCFVKKMDKRE